MAGKTFLAFPAHAHPQFSVSGKRPMDEDHVSLFCVDMLTYLCHFNAGLDGIECYILRTPPLAYIVIYDALMMNVYSSIKMFALQRETSACTSNMKMFIVPWYIRTKKWKYKLASHKLQSCQDTFPLWGYLYLMKHKMRKIHYACYDISINGWKLLIITTEYTLDSNVLKCCEKRFCDINDGSTFYQLTGMAES